jgi:hypothetical protein
MKNGRNNLSEIEFVLTCNYYWNCFVIQQSKSNNEFILDLLQELKYKRDGKWKNFVEKRLS